MAVIVKYGASLGFVLGNYKIGIRAEPGHVAMHLICNTPVFFYEYGCPRRKLLRDI